MGPDSLPDVPGTFNGQVFDPLLEDLFPEMFDRTGDYVDADGVVQPPINTGNQFNFLGMPNESLQSTGIETAPPDPLSVIELTTAAQSVPSSLSYSIAPYSDMYQGTGTDPDGHSVEQECGIEVSSSFSAAHMNDVTAEDPWQTQGTANSVLSGMRDLNSNVMIGGSDSGA